MAKYVYKCVTECVRNDLADINGVVRNQRFRVGELIESPRAIDSPKFELTSYLPDPPPPKVEKSETVKAKKE